MLAYYDGDVQILDKAPGKPATDDEVLVARMAKVITAPEGERRWVVAAIGSSVTAGHDTFESVTYPEVLGRKMQPLWESLGVASSVRNQGFGGRGPGPWFFCLRQIVGDDADVLIREWEFWGWEDSTKPGQILNILPLAERAVDLAVAGVEAFLHHAMELDHQPAVHLLKMNTEAKSLSYLHEWLAQEGPLAAYGRFSINVFDGFGQPFDHFGSRDRTRLNKHGTGTCKSASTKECPVNQTHQDGHHENAAWLGFDPVVHPGWVRDAITSQNDRYLFVNWHPAPLGHEVLGNQLAYYQMGVLEAALLLLLSPDFSAAKLAKAATMPLPVNVKCSDEVCNPQFSARCAYMDLPAAQGPHFTDLVNNEEVRTQWVEAKIVDDRNKSCRELRRGPDSAKSFRLARDCSYRDESRGLLGTIESGPLRLAFTDMYQCKILIGDSYFGAWNKKTAAANWKTDIVLRLNGRVCRPPRCVLGAQGTMSFAYIDARDEMGSSCRRQAVQVDVEVSPGEPAGHRCVFNAKSKCVVDKRLQDYSGYRDGDLCQAIAGNCTTRPRYTDRSSVQAFVSWAIAT